MFTFNKGTLNQKGQKGTTQEPSQNLPFLSDVVAMLRVQLGIPCIVGRCFSIPQSVVSLCGVQACGDGFRVQGSRLQVERISGQGLGLIREE